MRKKPNSDYAIQTVVNALRLLEAFQEDEELGVTQLSKRLVLHKNNVFRLLATLAQEGYIEQSDESDRYRLGVKSLELGQAFGRHATLLRRARPLLVELAEQTREAAHLAVMRGFEVVHLDAEVPDLLVVAASRVGRRLPLHCTALGKALLGCSAERVREDYDRTVVNAGELEGRTTSTIVDPHKFFEHLRTVSVQGFATDLEECEPGLCCAAAPVFDASGRVVAAVSVSGPEFRLGEDRLLGDIVAATMTAAERLSRGLGYGG